MTFGFCTPFGTNDTAWQQCSFDVFGLIHSQLRVVTRLSATASRLFALRRSISLSLCVWVRTSHTRDVSDQRSQQRLQAIWSVEHSGNRKKKAWDTSWTVHPSRNSSVGEIPNSQSNLVEHTYRPHRVYRPSGARWALHSGLVPCKDPCGNCT